MSQQIVGSFETVSLPELKLDNVMAKIDTGAYSGAIHCTDIQINEDANGNTELNCHPAGNTNLTFKTTNFLKTVVTSASGHRSVRYVITTDIIVRNKQYEVVIGLSDRSDLKCPVLIGRRFLREQNILVDVSQNAEYDTEGKATS